MIVALVLAFLAFAAVSYFLPDPPVKKVCYFGMVVCVVVFAIIMVMHIAGIVPGTWPYTITP